MKTLPEPLREFAREIISSLIPTIRRAPGRAHAWLSHSEVRIRGATLTGLTLIAAGFLWLSVHMISICDLARQTESTASRGSLRIGGVYRSALGILDALEAAAALSPSTAAPAIPTTNGLAVIREGVVQRVRGQLDPSDPDSAWQAKRLRSLVNLLAERFTASGGERTTAVLGLERLYRTEGDLREATPGFEGSLVIGRAWAHRGGWDGLFVFVPVRDIERGLRLNLADYDAGAYDYVLKDDGAFVTYPKRYHVAGSTLNGEPMRYATERADIGKRPLLAQNSDYITSGLAGSGRASKMYNELLKKGVSRQTYRNLRGDYKITIGTALYPADYGLLGDTLFVVSSTRIPVADVVLARVFLPDLISLVPTVWWMCSLFLLALAGWLAYAWLLQKRYQRLLFWKEHMGVRAIERSGLLNSRGGRVEWRDREAVLIRIRGSKAAAALRSTMELASALREAGWLTLRRSADSVIGLWPPSADGGAPPWSPSRFVESASQGAIFEASRVPTESVAVVWDSGGVEICWQQRSRDDLSLPLVAGQVVDELSLDAETLIEQAEDAWGALWYREELETKHSYQRVGESRAMGAVRWRRVAL